MNAKKLLAGVLSAAMVLSSMAIPVFASGDGSEAEAGAGDETAKKISVTTSDNTTTQYDTLEEAAAAAKDGDTVTLLYNTTSDREQGGGLISLGGKTVTFDGGGHELNGGIQNWEGNLTIKNANVAAKPVTVTDKGEVRLWAALLTACGYKSNAETIVESGTFTSDNAVIAVMGGPGTVTLKDGTYTGDGEEATVIYVTEGTVNVYGGTYSGPELILAEQQSSGEAIVNIYGGTFSGKITVTKSSAAEENATVNIYGGTFDTDVSAYLADGKMLTKNTDGTYTVTDVKEKLDNTNITEEEKIDTINSVVVTKDNTEVTEKVVETIKDLSTEAKEKVEPAKVEEIIEAVKQAATESKEDAVATGNGEASIGEGEGDNNKVEAKAETIKVDGDVQTLTVTPNEKETSINLPSSIKAAYFDVTLKGANETVISEPKVPVVVTFTVPDSIKDKVRYVFRSHDGVLTSIPFTRDGSVIKVTLAKFSDIALGIDNATEDSAKITFEADATTSDDFSKTYKMYLTATTEDTIKNFDAGEFSIKNKGNANAEITGTDNLTVAYDNAAGKYKIYRKGTGTTTVADSPTPTQDSTNNCYKIQLGKVTLTGNGSGMLFAENIAMHKTTTDTTETTSTDIETTSAVLDYSLTAPTQTLMVKVSFPNSIVNQATAYQDMKVTISGGDLTKDISYSLGSDSSKDVVWSADDQTYTLTVADKLTKGINYAVKVSGAGYRTAEYYVLMSADKTLNFWNNYKQSEVIETGNDASKASTTFLAGDIVKDAQINIYDLSAVVSYFGTENDVAKTSNFAKYDLNRDGKIDSKDIAYVLNSWGK